MQRNQLSILNVKTVATARSKYPGFTMAVNYGAEHRTHIMSSDPVMEIVSPFYRL